MMKRKMELLWSGNATTAPGAASAVGFRVKLCRLVVMNGCALLDVAVCRGERRERARQQAVTT